MTRTIKVPVTHFENTRAVKVIHWQENAPPQVVHVEVPDMDNPSRTETVEVQIG